uniref:Peroxisomal membrane protein MPV17 n=1 Tax=Chlamydomonas leiostraca TaxID=1034604 RepID=A0A7S0N794_9CHLO|mmetsp:Transcript_10401/g.25850  ORF Transcript_10401/g.25850 Transcript_10401/m.25850 type:complete len:212 (+) Transcript_10401:107-742(+)
MAAVLSLAWQRYLFNLNQKPLRTKALTSAFIAGLSDVIAQRIISGGYKNSRRTLAIACYGLIWNGPSAHFWQKFMEYLFPGKTDMKTVLKKVLIDQLSYGPVCNLLFMSFATTVLEGRSLVFLRAKVQRDYPLVQLNGWKVWPLAALINYRFVPLQFRVLFINCVALCWSIFLLMRARNMAGLAPAPAPQQQQQPAQQAGAKATAGVNKEL